MKKNVFLGVILIALLFGIRAAAKITEPEPEWARLAGAHDVPYKRILFKAETYGAVSDGATLNTKAIQKAIDACSAKGGGMVVFAPGKYLTGALFLKENVHLQIDRGVEILGSQHIEDYPEIDTRIGGVEMKWPAALINIINQGTVAITGDGIINAQGKPFWDKYNEMRKDYESRGLNWAVDYDAKRPRALLISSSTNITVTGITLQQAAFCTVQVLYSTFVTINSVAVRNNIDGHGPGTDGIDIDSSSYVLLQNCDIDSNDEAFCLKAGRDADGLRVNRPTEYIVIRNSVARAGAGLLTIGSETSGSIRHVLATYLTGSGIGSGLNIKSATTRGGTVEDIHFQNSSLNGVATAIQITITNASDSYPKLPEGYKGNIPPYWKKLLEKVEPVRGIPHIQDIYLSDIRATGTKKAIDATGLKESALRDFHFSNVSIDAATTGDVEFANNWTFEKCAINAADGSKVNVKQSSGVVF